MGRAVKQTASRIKHYIQLKKGYIWKPKVNYNKVSKKERRMQQSLNEMIMVDTWKTAPGG